MNPQLRRLLNEKMKLLADGERTAFDSVYEIVWPIVHRFSVRFLNGDKAAEDVAQEALIKVFSRAAQFRRESEALPWILTLATFECRTHMKKISRRKENVSDMTDMTQISSEKPLADSDLYTSELNAALRECLDELSQSDRDSLMAAYFDLGAPEVKDATFRKRVQRAMRRLKTVWSKHHD